MFHLKEGDKAPLFSGINQNGQQINTNDLKGKKYVIYFYPKDMTPGCTMQACNIRDHQIDLKKEGITVIGVSKDSIASHVRFTEKKELNFDLISDENKEILNLFGVYGPKKFMGKTYDGIHRTTFVMDETNTIIKIITKPKVKVHTQEILDAYDENQEKNKNEENKSRT